MIKRVGLESLVLMVCNACKKITDKSFFSSADQNQQYQDNVADYENSLIFYEYTLHHKLRASWARVHGLIYLLNMEQTEEDEKKIKRLLTKNLEEMDRIMNDVSRKLSSRKIKSNQ